MYIVIAGCGRLGASLATELSSEDHDVVVVDRDPASFKRLGRSFGGVTVVGTAIDEDVLRQAQIERADVFAAVTSSDTANIMAAQIARQIFDVSRAIARISDPERESAYRGLGFITVCPTAFGVFHTKAAILANGLTKMASLGDGVDVVAMTVERELVNKPLGELNKPWGVVHAVRRGGTTIVAEPNLMLVQGDCLVVTGGAEQWARAKFRPMTRR
ncbi:MAG: potassium channel family protein [Bacillota bacterium]